MSKKKKRRIRRIKKLVTFLKNVYGIISVLSTITIFSGLVLFLYGRVVRNNISDNDLIMNQIKDEIGSYDIFSITTADIHGFGNDSIIITAGSNDITVKTAENKLLILDSLENEILRGMNDLVGMKPNYKTTFTYTLSNENIVFRPETEYILDIIGDSTKEIMVKYFVTGSTYGANVTGVYMYSYEEEKYELIGTYPENEKMNTSRYDDNGNIIEARAHMVNTHFNDGLSEAENCIRCYDGSDYFLLTEGSWYSREYWVDNNIRGRMLVTINIDKYYNEETYMNIYETIYNKENNNLSWNLLYSENIKDFPRNYNKQDIMDALSNILDGTITILEKEND